MLLAIRDKAQGWIAWAIVILISIPFALWGINEYLGVGGDPVVAEVDGVEITDRELDSAIQRYRNVLRERLGASYNPDMFPDSLVRQQVLDSMIRDVVIAGTAADLGLRAGNDMVRSSIRQVPAFQRGGQFDPAAYESALRVQGYTPASFEARLRDDLATTLLERGITDGALVTEQEVKNYISLLNQVRDFSYVEVPASRFADGAEPGEDAVKAYYEENASLFIRPERAKVAYLELSRDFLAENISLSEEDLREHYEARKAEFTAPEQRRVRHILVAAGEGGDEAALEQAQALLSRLRAGEDFAELAKAHSSDPGSGAAGGDLGLLGRGVMVAPFEESAYSLEPGVVSEPVKTQFGYHLIEVTEVVPEHVQSFDEARERISKSWRQDEAERQFYDQAERLADLAYENPGSLVVAGDALDLKVQESDWISANGGAGDVLDSPKVLAAAFSEDVLERGNNSEAIELDATHMLVLRVMEHEDATPRPIEEVRDEIVTALKQQQAATAAKQLADEILAAVKAGESLEGVAAANDLTPVRAEGTNRAGSDEHPAALVGAAFTAGLPQEGSPVFGEAELGGGDRAVFALERVTNADTSELGADEISAARAQMTGRRAERELSFFVAQQRADASVTIKEPVTSE